MTRKLNYEAGNFAGRQLEFQCQIVSNHHHLKNGLVNESGYYSSSSMTGLVMWEDFQPNCCTINIRHSVRYWGCLSLRNFDARGPSQKGARRPGRRPAGHSDAGLYGCGVPDRTGCPVRFRPSGSGRSQKK